MAMIIVPFVEIKMSGNMKENFVKQNVQNIFIETIIIIFIVFKK